MGLSKLQEMVKGREAWCGAVHGFAKVRHNWATKQEPHKKYWCSVHTLSHELTAGELSAHRCSQVSLVRQAMTVTLPDSMCDFQPPEAVPEQHLTQWVIPSSQQIALPWFCNSTFSRFSNYLLGCNFSVIFTENLSSFWPLRCWNVQGSFFRNFTFSVYNHFPRGPHPVFSL